MSYLAAVHAVVETEIRELDHARVATVQADVALLDRLIVDLKIDLHVIARRVAEVADVDGETVGVLLTEDDAARFDTGDRGVPRRVVAPDVERRELRRVGEFESRVCLP